MPDFVFPMAPALVRFDYAGASSLRFIASWYVCPTLTERLKGEDLLLTGPPAGGFFFFEAQQAPLSRVRSNRGFAVLSIPMLLNHLMCEAAAK